jgi:hypothetical protein
LGSRKGLSKVQDRETKGNWCWPHLEEKLFRNLAQFSGNYRVRIILVAPYTSLCGLPQQNSTNWIKKQVVFSQFLRLDVWNQGMAGVDFFWGLSCRWYLLSVFSQGHLCTCLVSLSMSEFPLLMRTPVILD